MKKKILAAVLVAAMAAMTLIGCGKKEEAKTDAPAVEETTDATETEETVAEEPVVEEPVVEEPVSDIIIGTPEDAKFTAYIGLQSPKYTFRNAWCDSSYGLAEDSWSADNVKDLGYNFDALTGWVDNVAVKVPATFTDAYIVEDGKYEVSATGIEWPDGEFESQDYMNLIFISTNIPVDCGVEISDVVLKINGSEVSHTGSINDESKDYMQFNVQNIWNETCTTCGYYSVPFSDIAIQFTVTGVADAAVAAGSDDAEDAGEVEKAEIPMPEGPAVATLNLNNDDWTVSAAGNATITTAEVTGDGDYTVTAEFTEDFTSGQFNALEISEGELNFGREYVVTVTSIKVDGVEVMEGDSYTCSADGGAVITRVNLYNDWNTPNTDVSADGYVDCRANGDVTACSAKLIPYNTTGKVWEVSFNVSGALSR